jgi:hypothetical protein
MVFDEHYTPLLHQTNLLAIAEIIHRAMPVFNASMTWPTRQWWIG